MAVQIFNADGAGRQRLKVIAAASKAALPATAKDGTIAVITTTAVGTVWAQADEPASHSAGDVWIKTGLSSTAPINLATKGSALLYPKNAAQYIGGQWVSVTLYTRSNSVWVIGLAYLYNRDTFTSMSGGGFISPELHSSTNTSYWTFNLNASDLYFQTNYNGYYGEFFSGKVDAALYSTLHVKRLVPSGKHGEIKYVTNATTKLSASNNNVLLDIAGTGTIIESVVDITAMNSEVYFGFGGTSTGRSMTIYEYWLE